jgi:hypothetical protein
MDITIPEDGLQGGQTLEEVMDELTDPLDQSSRMDINEFVPDYDEDSILGNSDTEPVELQELDPGMVDSLFGPSATAGLADSESSGNSKSASTKASKGSSNPTPAAEGTEEPMEEREEDTPKKRGWKVDRVPPNSADDEPWQPVVSKQTKKQQAKAAKEELGAPSPIRVPPPDSRAPTLTQAQIQKNARDGLKETYGSRESKSQGNDWGESSSKRGRSTSSNGTEAPRKKPDTREKSCVR